MKTLRIFVNLVCVLVLMFGLVSRAPAASAAQESALHTYMDHSFIKQTVEQPAKSAVTDELSPSEWADIQAQIQAAEYYVTWQQHDGEGAYHAPNRAQGFEVTFAPSGLSASGGNDERSSWNFELVLTAYGDQPVAPAELSAEQARVTAAHGSVLSEWYENTPQGLKHGMTLFAPPEAGTTAQTLDFTINSNLQTEVAPNGGLRLKNSEGAILLAYDGLAVFDANGQMLPARMALTEDGLRISLETRGAVYPLTVDPLLHSETDILRASDAQDSAEFGSSVAMDGNTLVIGAPSASITGTAYVFQRNQGGADAWGEVAMLRASEPAKQGETVGFGTSVAVSEDIIVIGAPYTGWNSGGELHDLGAAYVFQRNEGGTDNWGQVAMLIGSDSWYFDEFGKVVSIDGDTIVIGSSSESVYIFQRNQGGADAWGEVAILSASDTQVNDWFGSSVAIDGDTIVVGAPWEDGGPGNPASDAGAAYVFQRNQGGADVWGEVTILRASDTQIVDWFGSAVAIAGDTIVIGAPGEDGGPGNPLSGAGAAYVFQRNQGGVDNWGEVTILHASDAFFNDGFGSAVVIDADTIVLGAPFGDGPGGQLPGSGAAYVFQRNQGGADAWGEVNILYTSDSFFDDQFGTAVAISGNTIIAGAPYEDGGLGDPLLDSGAVYLFNTSGIWREKTNLHASDANYYEEFGHSVAVDGNTLVVGAHYDEMSAGAAYVFSRNQGGADAWGEVAILRASNAQSQDYFGTSVSITGDTIVVGAPREDGASELLTNAGAAYVFQRNYEGANNWGEVTILRASDTQVNNYFGWAAAIDGDTIVVGTGDPHLVPPPSTAGAAYVFQRNQGGADAWGEVDILHASDAQDGDGFGSAVAISGDVIAVGAPGEDGGVGDPLSDAGATYVFYRNLGGADQWDQVQVLHPSNMGWADEFGSSVAIDNDTLVVSAPREDGGPGNPLSNAGAAYVFQRNQGGADIWGEVTILRASDAQAGDYFGDSFAVNGSVSIDGDTIVIGAPSEDGGPGNPLPDAGAAYVFQRNQGGADAWGQVRTLRASDAQDGDLFGAVAVSGNTLVVGAIHENGGPGDPLQLVGAAYVYMLQDGWEPIEIPQPITGQVGDLFGAVALSGNTLVVGAPDEDGGPGDPLPTSGVAYIFYLNNTQWSQVAELRASDAQGGDYFGWAVAIYSDTVVIGAPYEDGGPGDTITNTGAAYIFQRNQGGTDNWGEVTILHASDAQAYDWFGYSISIDNSTIAIGAHGEDGGPGDPLPDAGAVYLFEFTPTTKAPDDWGQVGTLNAGPSAGEGDGFGSSLSLDGDTLAIGAPGEDGGFGDPITDTGVAYIFEFTPTEDWGQVGTLNAGPNAGEGDGFGSSVSLDGDTLAVGAPFEDGGLGDPITDTGAAYVFGFTPTKDWGQVGTLNAGTNAGEGDGFGSSLALDSGLLVVGAPFDDGGPGNPITDTGAAYIFGITGTQRTPVTWGNLQTLRSPEAQAGDRFGDWIALEGQSAAIGAPYEDGGPTNPITDTGAAYVFSLVLPNTPPLALNNSVTVNEDSSANLLDVLANDSDINLDALVITAVSTPTHGIALDNDLNVLYTPTPDFFGTDSFTYTISDGNGGYASAAVSITVLAVNDAPMANDLVFSTTEDTIYTGTLTASDPDSSVLTFTLEITPLHGTVEVATRGAFTYTPTLNYNGTDVFTFTVSDGISTDTGRVDISVLAENDAPVPTDQAFSTPEDAVYTGTLTAYDPDSSVLTFTLEISSQHGTAEVASNGAFTYTPALDYNGTDVFTFTVSDGSLSASGRVDVSVLAVNDAPVANDLAFSMPEDAVYTDTLTASDPDSSVLTFTLETSPQYGSIEVASNGAFTYTPALDFIGTDVFTFTVSDESLSDIGRVDIRVMAGTYISLTAQPSPSAVGQMAVFSATVRAGLGIPTGRLVFREGATELFSTTLDANGLAIFSTDALTLGEHTITAEYLGTPEFLPTSNILTHTVAYMADLQISVLAELQPLSVTYTIVVQNAGFNAADGAQVQATIQADLINLQWTCVASGGASCTPSGSGDLDDILSSFPAGSSVTYTVSAQRLKWHHLTMSASVTPPPGLIDPTPGNNQAVYQPIYLLAFPLLFSR